MGLSIIGGGAGAVENPARLRGDGLTAGEPVAPIAADMGAVAAVVASAGHVAPLRLTSRAAAWPTVVRAIATSSRGIAAALNRVLECIAGLLEEGAAPSLHP